ncbi:PDR/VanB family oxidoreductase [Nocardioides ginsengisoli]|uniref:PDR/VanB family oxidoreductase n=1 Tax=Nocardioides ginsengisoli TaxID=363868 RepID=A0ABW3W7M3_9ACTN
MRTTHDEQELRMRVRQMRWEADRVVSLDLERIDGGDLPAWTPGAHVDLHLPGVITRQYSLTGAPADRRTWRIAVLHEESGRGGSRAVHTQVRAGDELTVVGPRNNFPLDPASDYLFVAGGIGITPLVPMLAAAEAAGASWRLVYGGRTRSAMAFASALAAAHPKRVDVVPQDERGLLDLPSLLGNLAPETQVYCCGPEPLLAAVEALCLADRLHVERFAARPRSETEPGAERAFEVVLQQSGDVVPVAPGQSVLEALEARGLDVPNSCREGICGTCETKVIDGIPDHRDSLLSDEERAANDTMMVCVGRALSDRLVLDL